MALSEMPSLEPVAIDPGNYGMVWYVWHGVAFTTHPDVGVLDDIAHGHDVELSSNSALCPPGSWLAESHGHTVIS